MRRHLKLTTLCLATVINACASDSGNSGATLDVSFPDDASREETSRLELTVFAGGCEGGELLFEADIQNGEMAMPFDLGPGRHGVRAVATSVDCIVTAAACTEFEAPTARNVALSLESDGRTYACPGAVCIDGSCVGPEALPAASPITTAGSGVFTTCATEESGELHCWGRNELSQLGLPEADNFATPQRVEAESAVEEVDGGWRAMCVRRSNGEIACAGEGANGLLGTGNTANRMEFTAIAEPGPWAELTVGYRHACARKLDGRVFCWGGGSPEAASPAAIGTDPPSVPVMTPVEVGMRWTAVSAGGGHTDRRSHTCAIRTDARLFCWGSNEEGQLGLGDTNTRPLPTQVSDDHWADVAVGGFHTCGIKRDGSLWCWGIGVNGQNGGSGGDPILSPRRVLDGVLFRQLDLDDRHSCAVDEAGTVYCWGAANLASGRPTVVPTEEPIARVFTLYHSTMLIDRGGDVFVWGTNSEGQLGVGDLDDRLELTPFPGF